MGTIAKTMVGARAKLYINGVLVGIFNSASYGVNYGTNPIHTLGRYNVQEIPYTDMDVINLNLSGFRVMENGPFAKASVPKLQDLLLHEDIVVSLIDRQNESDPNKGNIVTVVGCRPTGFDTSTSARGVQDLSVRMQGIKLQDESGDQDDVGAVDYQ